MWPHIKTNPPRYNFGCDSKRTTSLSSTDMATLSSIVTLWDGGQLIELATAWHERRWLCS